MPANDHPTPAPLTVYFDGSCPLCRREIAYYRGLPGSEKLAWVDVSDPEQPLGGDLDCRTALARFHVRDTAGRLHQGGIAFALLWQQLPRWRWAGRLFARPPMSWLLDTAYRLFLPVRPWLQKRLGRWLDRGRANHKPFN